MKKLLYLFLLFPFLTKSQGVVPRAPVSVIAQDANLYTTFNFKIPVYADTTAANLLRFKDSIGLMIFARTPGNVYVRDTSTGTHKWSIITGGGGAVSDVFGRTGHVVATSADYSSFYPLLSGAYNDPTWINTLSASKIAMAGNVTAGSTKITLGGTASGASLQNFSIDVNQANLNLASIGGLLGVTQINATGTPSASTVLYGNGTWGAAAGGGTGLPNSNVGTGYRWAIPTTNNIKTAFGAGYIVLDSTTNTNGITFYPDTAAGKLATKTDLLAYGLLSGKLSQFAATSSAELAGVLSDEYGSGRVLYAPAAAHNGMKLGVVASVPTWQDTTAILPDSGIYVNSTITKTITGTSIGLKVDTSVMATKSYVNNLTDSFTLRTPGTGTGAIPYAFTNAGALVIPKHNFLPPLLVTVQSDSLITHSVDTSNGLTHLATQAYADSVALANGGGGGSTNAVGRDSVITITSGTSSTVTNGYNIVVFDPSATLGSTYTLTLPTTWHTSKDLKIYFGGTVTSGAVVTLNIVNGSGQTLSQSINPNGRTWNAGEFLSYHLVGTYDRREN